MEALLAFFLESTFLGLWIFGWGRIPKKVHLATLWAAVIGSIVSAYFIIAANSWMQHPVGVVMDDATGRPRQVDIGAVLTNNTALAAFSHAIVAALMVAGALLVGIGLWHLRRRKLAGQPTTDVDHQVWRRSVRLGGWVSLAAFLAVAAHRRLAGQAHVRAAAAEDELGRGAVRDRGAGVLLDLRLEQAGLQRVRRRPLDHRARACCPSSRTATSPPPSPA